MKKWWEPNNELKGKKKLQKKNLNESFEVSRDYLNNPFSSLGKAPRTIPLMTLTLSPPLPTLLVSLHLLNLLNFSFQTHLLYKKDTLSFPDQGLTKHAFPFSEDFSGWGIRKLKPLLNSGHYSDVM